MKIVRTVNELKSAVGALKAEGRSVGFVPTMGALHDGHISLINRARADNDIVVASVFVNPTQFNNPDDLRTYPRTEEADCARLGDAGVDIAFLPSVEEMYPEPDTRVFKLGPVAEVMEGAMRPGHFNGVAQVVSRLFAMVGPDRAYFGEKDFQQIAVIRRMVELEGFDIDIVACPIKREADGLALSSRNVRLTPHQRDIAPNIHRILEESRDYYLVLSVDEVRRKVIDAVNAYPEMEVEYYDIVNADDMQPINEWSQCADAVGCITVYLGDVRLIDNIKYNQL
ncbi:MAG TPA: pantoate--beta-alanine ligase [Muribaculum sp.]|jgi:pantoate--beta-alanine ligase|uniref:Pantothenate synthetase n=1 Tax=Heminiphilus faecis TaxID=2601703 RepID=A0ABV4CTC6_9BACT|nr:pantoate--beta-alanine ligase [Heminiphilus faecis]RLT76770.1 pantoate--beta-alanine ligase [bacterium J10(2018)]HRF67651.1 pantoate--beta-alanine ligase [Muribaculum sp.]